jgi:DNA-binding CsgD family transcriptional regulator
LGNATPRARLREGADLIARFRSYDQRLVLLVSAAGWMAAASSLPAAVEAWATAAHGREGDFWLAQQEEERANRAARDGARVALGAARFDALWSAGWARGLDEAADLAMSTIESVDLDRLAPTRASGRRGPEALTAREREVLALVASGASDGDIAEALFISKKTASVHVASIKGKLGASSRIEIARIALGVAADPSRG